jgi:hypothetical protein
MNTNEVVKVSLDAGARILDILSTTIPVPGVGVGLRLGAGLLLGLVDALDDGADARELLNELTALPSLRGDIETQDDQIEAMLRERFEED